MQKHRLWIEILLLATVVACAIALLIATIGAAAGATAAEASAREQESAPSTQHAYEGMVTCSRCLARHSRVLDQTATDCTRICVRGGARFALVESDTTYLLDGDLATLGKFAGQRARVFGELNGKTIRITSVVSET